MIRAVEKQDYQPICAIYNYYVHNSIATFEEQEVEVLEMAQRINALANHHNWIVLEIDNKIVGYAYSYHWNKRAAYKRTVESSVYVRFEELGNGYGGQLYSALFNELKQEGFVTTIIAGISLPNPHSAKMHEAFGFKKVAHLKKVGYKFDKWIDVGYWQMFL